MDTDTALAVFVSCVQSMVQLTLITFSGAVLTGLKIFTEQTNATVAQACAHFFFPIFIFISLGQSLSLSKLIEEWPLFVNPMVIVFLSTLVGLLQIYLFPPARHLRFSMLCMMCINNSGNVPLLILYGACKSYGPLGGESACSDAQGYVVLQVFTYNVLTWTYGLYLFQLDQMYRCEVLLEKDPESAISAPQQSRVRMLLKNLVSPVPMGSYLGLLAGITPGMRWLMFDEDAPLRSVADALELVGMVGIVLSQMILGSNLVLTYGRPASLSRPYIYTSHLTRLILIPLLGLGATKLYQFAGIGSGNRVERFVLFLGFASPTAVSVLVLAQLTQVGVNELTKMMFGQYVLAVLTLTLSNYAFFLIF